MPAPTKEVPVDVFLLLIGVALVIYALQGKSLVSIRINSPEKD